ncbi:hypothetical protein DOT_1567 [Desulfosporosinus sp. OT]|nr:hypothetical protein DOT_1567 [Desulfosporosinus sp. OT]
MFERQARRQRSCYRIIKQQLIKRRSYLNKWLQGKVGKYALNSKNL